MKEQQPEKSIYSKVSLTKELMDIRVGKYGLKFGTVEKLCQQYGIKCVKHENHNEFKAPKLRLQLFIEKLHFSKTPYSKKPL